MSARMEYISNRIIDWTFGHDRLIYNMDLLSRILERSRIENHVLVHHSLAGDWGYSFPCHRSGGFHVINRGRCFLRSESGVEALEKGDVVFVMRGVTHELLSAPDQKARPIDRLAETSVANQSPARRSRPVVDLVSVRYEFPDGEAHPFFKELPEILVVRGRDVPAHHPLAQTLSLLSQESAERYCAALILQRLTDILLYYALRQWLEMHPAKKPGYRNAMGDPKVVAALDALHRRPAYAWTLDKLAESVGLSRAGLALRFRVGLGVTPMDYLTRLRLEAGRTLLAERNCTLEEIASRVGYSTAFAFSKAFKRVYGHSPRSERASANS